MKGMKLFFLSLGVLAVSGCATTMQKDAEITALKSQVTDLETRLREKDRQLSGAQTTDIQQGGQALSEEAVDAKPTVLNIQTALRNAGYDPGPVDGKMGRKTRSAIRQFQKDNSLIVDGQVGKQTWSMLSKFLVK